MDKEEVEFKTGNKELDAAFKAYYDSRIAYYNRRIRMNNIFYGSLLFIVAVWFGGTMWILRH